MPTEPSKEAVEALHDAIFAAIEPHAEDLDPDETHGEAVKRVLHRELPAIHQRWEQEVRERLEAVRKELCFCPGPGEENTEICDHCQTLGYTESEIFGEAEPVEEGPSERVERLEAELVEAEAAVERKRQEDGP